MGETCGETCDVCGRDDQRMAIVTRGSGRTMIDGEEVGNVCVECWKARKK